MKISIKYFPLFLVILFISIDRFAVYCLNATSCLFSNSIWPIFFVVIKPLYLFSLIFTITAFVLAFVSIKIFNSWLRFAMWWLPLSVILIAITPSTSNSWMPLYFIGKDTVALVMSALFTLISLVIIVWKQFGLRKKLT